MTLMLVVSAGQMRTDRCEHILMAHLSRSSFVGLLFLLPVRFFLLKIIKMVLANTRRQHLLYMKVTVCVWAMLCLDSTVIFHGPLPKNLQDVFSFQCEEDLKLRTLVCPSLRSHTVAASPSSTFSENLYL